MARRTAAAGMFYGSEASRLRAELESCFTGRFGPGRIPTPRADRVGSVIGLVCPHAGYVYSGAAAAHAYAELAEDGFPETAFLLGPNHYGLGAPVAISREEEWITPLGTVSVDRDAAELIVEHSDFAEIDDSAHLREHSLEVQVPFLQYLGADATKIVPISIGHLSLPMALDLCADLGAAIGAAAQEKSTVVIASTDFTHYESRESARRKDALAIQKILELDGPGLLRLVSDMSISMCGVVPTAAAINACKHLGATAAKKLTYYTSGDVTGDTTEVVGYASLSIVREP